MAMSASLSLAAGACGGIVQTGEPSPAGSSDTPPMAASGGAQAGGDPRKAHPTVELPECQRGFSSSAEPGRACPYTVDGLCYAAKLDACACACKARAGTTCTSGFPELDGTTAVTCL